MYLVTGLTRIKGIETNHGPGKVRKTNLKRKWIIPFFIEAQISLIKHVALEEDHMKTWLSFNRLIIKNSFMTVICL